MPTLLVTSQGERKLVFKNSEQSEIYPSSVNSSNNEEKLDTLEQHNEIFCYDGSEGDEGNVLGVLGIEAYQFEPVTNIGGDDPEEEQAHMKRRSRGCLVTK